MLSVVPIYGAALTVLFLVLSARVIRARGRFGVSLGDGGEADLTLRIRAHGNFVEYAGFGLVLLVIAELSGAPVAALHLVGTTLVVGRLCHAISFLVPRTNLRLRVTGMALSLIAIAGATVLPFFG